MEVFFRHCIMMTLAATVAITWVRLHYSAIICTGCGLGSALRSNSAYWCTRQSTALHHVIWTNHMCIPVRLFLTFLLSVPLPCSFPEKGYNSETGNFVWLVRSPGTLYHWTFVRHLHYYFSETCSRHIFSHVLTSLTNCFESTSSEHCTAPL